ncbi:MAG: glycosyltransferase family 2 protein [Bryobacteraceae bacterium]|nr:glycosyltransferase family 2 protein [Bryobacteraceae bacterium]
MTELTIAGAVALGMIFFFVKSRRNYLALPELPAADFREPPQDVIVVVPARNEEANIARVVSSFPQGWVLVVDDHSTDGTAMVAKQNTAEVIYAPQLAAGQMGKPNACAAGARATASDWILFVDADTWYAPEFLPSLMDYAESEKLDMVSVFPRQITKSFWEAALLPYAFALLFTGVDGRAVNDPLAKDAMANGQCILFRRKFYEFIGGHTSVSESVIEDADLARRAKQHRGAVQMLRAEKLAFCRMYSGFGEIWRGFSKNSFRFLDADRKMGAQVFLASFFVLNWLPASIMLASAEQWIALAAFLTLPVWLLAPWYGGVTAVLAPLGIYGFQLIALNGLILGLTKRKTTWKGRPV